MLHKTRLVKALAAAFGGTAALLNPALLYAQDSGTPPATPTEDVQRVTVTGTNVRRTDAETPSPVQVLTAEDIRQSGFTSIQEVLQNITANGQGSLSQGFSGAFASGASAISLRGLTAGATLVLIDGHRSAPYPIGDDGERAFVDIANIPFDAVERIEILKDGASAIYGSDAIAGVVNIILRRSYVGTSISGDVGTSWKRDGSTRRGSMIYGVGDLARDGHNFYVSIEGRSQDQIRFVDRGNQFTKTDYTSQGGINTTLGVPNSANGGYARSATGYLTDPDGNQYFLPGCNQASYDAGQCTYRDTWSQIQPTTSNFNAVSRFTFNLDPNWQASIEGTFFQSKAQQVGGPSRSFSNGYQGITSGPNVVPTLLDPLGPTQLPDTNPAFPVGTGLTTGTLRYTFLDVGPQTTDTDAKTTRLVADLQGSFMDWDLAAAIGYTQVKLAVRGYNTVEPALLQASLDSTTNPYIPGGNNSPAVIASIAPAMYSDDISKLEFGHFNASHDLMALDGGPLSLALGTDYFHRLQDATAPTQVAQGLTASFSNNYTIGYQTVWSAYGELVAPFRKDFEAELQARYDHYNLSGGRTSPKVGFKWTPSQTFALRGTYSRGFRAPNPAENGNAGQTFFAGSTNDPVLCADGNTQEIGNFPTECNIGVGTVQSTNSHLKPETSKGWTLGTILEPVRDFSASIDWYSIEIDNQIVAGSTQNTVRGTNFAPIPRVIDDQGDTDLEVPPVAPIAYFTTAYVNANKTKVSGIDLDLQLKERLGDFGEYRTNLTWSYMAKYDLTADGVTYHLAGTHGPLIIGGDTGNPRSRIQWANTVAHGPWEVTGTVNYISSFSLLDPSYLTPNFEGGYGVTDCPTALEIGAGSTAFEDTISAGQVPPGVSCRVGSFITFDLAGRYTIDKHWKINGSITNLFNQGAPLDWTSYGGGTAPYNPSFHQQGAIGRFYNVGATYTF